VDESLEKRGAGSRSRAPRSHRRPLSARADRNTLAAVFTVQTQQRVCAADAFDGAERALLAMRER
jgi:hypothetical protein